MSEGDPEALGGNRPAVMRAPLVPLAMALMLGIAAGRYVPISAPAWSVWAVLALAAGFWLALSYRLRAASVALAAAVIALGAIHYQTVQHRLPDSHVVTFAGPSRVISSVRGRIVGSPAIRAWAAQAGYTREPVTTFELTVEELLVEGRWQSVRGMADVTVLEPAPHLARGQRVQLAGWLSRITASSNPGQRDPAEMARLRGVLVRFRAPCADAATVLAESSGSVLGRVRDTAGRWAQRHIAGPGATRPRRLLEALVLGRRHPSLQGLRKTMAQAGVAHLLSISGMHLGIFLCFIYMLCRLVSLGIQRSAFVALVCLGAYLLLAEPRSPLLRSAIMAAAVCVGTMVNRPGSALNALALAGILLLVAEPAELMRPGFQLSFVTVAGLLLFERPTRHLLFGRFLRRRGLRVYRSHQRVRRWLAHTVADAVMGAVTVSLLAWAIAAPLAAYHFGAISPYGAPMTLVIAPFVVVALVLGYLGLLLAWAPNLSHAMISAGADAAETMARAVETAASLPGPAAELRPMGPLWVLAAYAAVVLFVLQRRLQLGSLWAGAAVLCLIVATVLAQMPASAPEAAELHVLDVGAGNCMVLAAPSGRTMVFDAGSLGRADCGEEVLLPFLRQRRLALPPVAAISHANADHYNGVAALVDRGAAREVYLNDYFGRGDDSASGPEVLDLMARLARARASVRRVRQGDVIRIDERTTAEVVWPPPSRGELATNDRSLVFRVRCDDRTVLVTGDISDEAQAALTDQPSRVRADVLILPHHGTWRDTLPAFVAAVDPEAIVVSSRTRPVAPLRGGRPAEEFYANLPQNYRYYVTAMDGYIRIRFGRGKVEEGSWR